MYFVTIVVYNAKMVICGRRDEDRITKKLVSSLNAFLMVDGLNLGDEVVKIHSSFRPFMVRTWLTTRDRDLKVLKCVCGYIVSWSIYQLGFH